MNKNMFFRALALVTIVGGLSFGLTGCASTSKSEPELSGTVAELYNDGMDQMAERRWGKAVHTFAELQRQYPYSGWATRAEMMSAYASLRAGDEDAAILTADQFIGLHPGHPDLAYMYYLKGIAHYNKMVDVNRDQSGTAEALEAFQEVVNRYPNSKYAADARMKITLCKDHLAGREMVVGRFYLNNDQYLAAINRFQAVVKNYDTTSQTPEALYRLVESYTALGVPDEAKRNAAILGANYPQSPWYSRAYALVGQSAALPPATQQPSTVGRVWTGLKDMF